MQSKKLKGPVLSDTRGIKRAFQLIFCPLYSLLASSLNTFNDCPRNFLPLRDQRCPMYHQSAGHKSLKLKKDSLSLGVSHTTRTKLLEKKPLEKHTQRIEVLL